MCMDSDYHAVALAGRASGRESLRLYMAKNGEVDFGILSNPSEAIERFWKGRAKFPDRRMIKIAKGFAIRKTVKDHGRKA